MQDSPDNQYGVSRLVAFSDGVFAFAITLLVTSIPTLDLPAQASNQAVLSSLRALFPSFFSYALSFYMVGVYWLVHHRTFRYIIKFDESLLWVNLTVLLFIAFLPFPTSLLGRYGDSSIVVAFYAVTLSAISLVYSFLWWYASERHRFIAQDLDRQIITRLRLRGYITLALFLISIGFAFISPTLAKATWLAIFVVRPLVIRRFMRES
ncbi:MAG TPA: TMEM175 family protein [Ktedonobacteraceae bacterium]|jgi:uncharacterized membrane protein